MNTFKMTPDTLINVACDVIDSIEKILSTSLTITHTAIYAQLEEDLAYSLSHLRDIFKIATNISLAKYITRRKYTSILLQMSYDDFKNLTMHAPVHNIQKFKMKCLCEFPFINDAYTLEHMQPPIDKMLLRDVSNIQLEKRWESYQMKSKYKNIIKGRTQHEITEYTGKIIIQNSNGMLVDLDKTYFSYKDKVFKITAYINLMQGQVVDPFLSMLFGQPMYSSYNALADANSVVHTLHKFITGNLITTNGFSLIIEWSHKHGCGSSSLISSMSFENDILTDINYVDNPFLLFDAHNVWINLSFFDRICSDYPIK